MFGIDAVELVLIVVVAILLFGPDKMPEYSRKAARIFVYLKNIANNTQSTLRDQLGPEYSDLELKDLNPKAFIAKHLSQEVAAIEEAKREIEEMKATLTDATKEVEGEVSDAQTDAKTLMKTKSGRPGKDEQQADGEPGVYVAAPFDVDAT
ncbi:MAG: Sec-independent protein translocase subunit TatB [Propionibacterium sp.]|nr:Sec-independent protein translocase subunit TatB [Propionibacterium sp.]